MPEGASHEGRDNLFHDLIADYLDARDAGENPDREELIRDHPEIASELRKFFRSEDLLGHLGGALGGRAGPRSSVAGETWGDYELVEEIARGGMGVVFRARQLSLDRPVALKMILSGRLASPEEVTRFHREARAAARLDHPNIVPVYETETHQGRPFFSMKLIEGGSLSSAGHRFIRSPDLAARLMQKVAIAVDYAHRQGVLHRDLKPGNILLDGLGEPIITDFGLARAMGSESSLTRPGALVGTPAYMSPEQAAGDPELSIATDIYSLGAILYELLSGRPPFVSDSSLETLRAVRESEPVSPRLLNPTVSRDLETICLKCMEKEPGRRYASAGDLADDLGRYREGLPIEARPISAAGRVARWYRRRPLTASLLSAVAVLLVLVVTVSLLAVQGLRREKEIATDRLRRAFLEQARADRLSRRAGSRGSGLAVLREAAALRPGSDVRDEAIGCLALTDLELVQEGQIGSGEPPRDTPGVMDLHPDLRRYALARGPRVSICRLDDDAEELSFTTGGYTVLDLSFSARGRYLALLCANHRRARPLPDTVSGVGLLLGAGREYVARMIPRALVVRDLEQAAVPVLALPRFSDWMAADFSPEEDLLVVGRSDGSLSIHRLGDGQAPETRTAPGQSGAVSRLSLHPGGRLVAVVIPSRRVVEIRDLRDGAIKQEFEHRDPVYTLGWHPDGRLLATGSDLDLAVWNVEEGRRTFSLTGHQAAVTDIAFHPGGSYLASTGWDGAVRLWDLRIQSEIVRASGYYQVRFSADGRRLGSFSNHDRFWLWNLVESGSCDLLLEERGVTNAVKKVALGPDGRLLATAGHEGVGIWDLPGRRRLALLPTGFTSWVHFERDGSALLSWGDPGLQRWPLHRRDRGAGGRGITLGPPRCLGMRERQMTRHGAISRDGKTIALMASEGRILQRDAPGRGEHETGVRLTGLGLSYFVAASPDGELIAGGTRKGHGVVIWNACDGAVLRRLPVTRGSSVEFSVDGTRLFTGEGQRYRAWSTRTWEPVWEVPRDNPSSQPGQIAVASPGGHIAVVHDLSEVRLLEAERGTLLARLHAPSDQMVSGMAFSDSGTLLVVFYQSNAIQLWDLSRLGRELDDLGLADSLAGFRRRAPGGDTRPLSLTVCVDGRTADQGPGR